MIGKEMVFTCKDRDAKQAWVEHLRRPFTYSPATPEERRLVRETICRTSSMPFVLIGNIGSYDNSSWNAQCFVDFNCSSGAGGIPISCLRYVLYLISL